MEFSIPITPVRDNHFAVNQWPLFQGLKIAYFLPNAMGIQQPVWVEDGIMK